jgi:UDP-N-acetylmuramoylalanine--D-glutamate ligase
VLKPEQLRGLRASIIGAAREGIALARFLVHCGAQVTLSDSKPASALGEAMRELDGLSLRLALGANPPDLLDVDVLFLSPGVPPYAPIVREARQKGLPISSEPRLFTQLCAAPFVGITGSSGKTTTTTLTARIFAEAGRDTWLGGNVGIPLTDRLIGNPQPEVAVLEFSSFQLQLFAPDYQGPEVDQRRSAASRVISLEGWSPTIAVITNITPNHLDRHPDMDDYVRAKANIMAFQRADGHPDMDDYVRAKANIMAVQRADDWLVLNADDSYTPIFAAAAHGHLAQFSLRGAVAQGAWLRNDQLLMRWDGQEGLLCTRDQIPLRGMHNVANVLAAACGAMAGGVPLEAIRAVISTFTGVAHRLEIVRRWQDVTFVNDSIATSPERAMAALRAFEEPIVLLAGGRDKHLQWDNWADLVLQRARQVIAFGEAAPIVQHALAEAAQRAEGHSFVPPLALAATLDEALQQAARLAQPGDMVLLSPGGTSFDAFKDFEERGERFRQLVAEL